MKEYANNKDHWSAPRWRVGLAALAIAPLLLVTGAASVHAASCGSTIDVVHGTSPVPFDRLGVSESLGTKVAKSNAPDPIPGIEEHEFSLGCVRFDSSRVQGPDRWYFASAVLSGRVSGPAGSHVSLFVASAGRSFLSFTLEVLTDGRSIAATSSTWAGVSSQESHDPDGAFKASENNYLQIPGVTPGNDAPVTVVVRAFDGANIDSVRITAELSMTTEPPKRAVLGVQGDDAASAGRGDALQFGMFWRTDAPRPMLRLTDSRTGAPILDGSVIDDGNAHYVAIPSASKARSAPILAEAVDASNGEILAHLMITGSRETSSSATLSAVWLTAILLGLAAMVGGIRSMRHTRPA